MDVSWLDRGGVGKLCCSPVAEVVRVGAQSMLMFFVCRSAAGNRC
jgi:hypothetical protein